MNMRVLHWLLLFFCVACGETLMPRPTTVQKSDRPACGVASWCAGAAEVDITPPLGIGLFGHGPESRIASGVQLRLRCQAFVLTGPAGPARLPNTVALVPCEIAAPSLLLQRTIAEYVGRRVPIAAHQIMLMATHTHLGPAHYFSAESYYGPFSSRLLGFDRGVFEYLAQRIAHVIVSAYERSVPAQLALRQQPIKRQLGRNRSYTAYLADNPPAWLKARVDADPEHAADKATDPMLSVLRIDRALAGKDAETKREPIGVLAVFGVHPTGMPNTTAAYSGDVIGYAARDVAAAVLSESGQRAVVGIANGIEGDVMVARNAPGLRDTRRLSRGLADEILESWKELGKSDVPLTGPLSVAYRELSLPGASLAHNDAKSVPALCQIPELGTPAGGGANDHPTALRAFPQYNPGVRTVRRRACEGHKLPVLVVSGRGEPGVTLPKVVSVAVIRIGTHVLVTLPGEMTTVAGIRLREAVARTLEKNGALEGGPSEDATAPRVIVVGLTNEYIQYVATQEEYALQLYEGASTLYGPESARFFESHAVCLARQLSGAPDDRCSADQSRVGELTDVPYTVPAAQPLLGIAEDNEPLKRGKTQRLTTPDGLVRHAFEFSGPAWTGFAPESARVHVRVCRADSPPPTLACDAEDDALIDDDTGWSVQTSYDATSETWTASWLPALLRHREAKPLCGNYRIVVQAGGEAVASDAIPVRVECPAGAP